MFVRVEAVASGTEMRSTCSRPRRFRRVPYVPPLINLSSMRSNTQPSEQALSGTLLGETVIIFAEELTFDWPVIYPSSR